MSDTNTDNRWPELSEATDNDVRDAPNTSVLGILPEMDNETPAEPEPEEEVKAEEVEAKAEEEAVEETENEAEARVKKLARDLREQKRRIRQQEAELAVLRGQKTEQPDEQVERLVEQRASEKAYQVVLAQKANAVYADGIKQFGRGDFDESITAVNEAFGSAGLPALVETMVDLPNAAAVYQHLADNPDILDDVTGLQPHRLGVALQKLSDKLATPKVKPMSKAPPPIKPVATTGAAETQTDPNKMSMAEYAKWYDAKKMKEKYGV